MKTATQPKDMQGNILQVGDRVALYSYHNQGLAIGIIEKLSRVRAQIRPIQTCWAKTVPTVESIGAGKLIKLVDR
jgi:hypothetical protein